MATRDAMRFEYSPSKGSCSLTHNLTTGKAEHPGACDDEGPPPLPCCGGLRGQHAQTLCPDKAIPHLFVVSIEPDDVDPGMVDVRAFAYHLAHQGADGTLQALCLPEGAIPRLGWYQLRALGEPVHAECKAALQAAQQQHLDDLQRAEDSHAQVFGKLRGVVTNLEAQLASERTRNERLMDRVEKLQGRLSELGDAYCAKLESTQGGSTTTTLQAERQAALQLALADLDVALKNLAQLDPTDPQRNELRAAQEALGGLWGTLRGLGLVTPRQAAQGATTEAK